MHFVEKTLMDVPDVQKESIRGRILREAKQLTEGDRNKSYGDPEPNMECFAGLVNAYIGGIASSQEGDFRGFSEVRLTSFDAAIIMGLAKISRIAANPDHLDSYLDLAAYAGIAGECAEVKRREIEEDVSVC